MAAAAVAPAHAHVLARDISLIVIFRAGLGMVDGLLELVPSARVGYIGLHRDQDTLEPVEYYVRERTQANFSHSICPDCMKEHYPFMPTDAPAE